MKEGKKLVIEEERKKETEVESLRKEKRRENGNKYGKRK
jgi:hypothetical protein